MIETEFGRWTLRLGVDSTRRAYSSIDVGSPECCGCDPCLNFAANRDANFPSAVRDFLTAAGISTDREAEIYHNCRLDSGLHSYGGWFHFVGEILSGGDAYVAIDERSGTHDLHDFGSNALAGVSTKTALVSPAFDGHRILQLEFAVEIPWVIDAAEVS